MIFQEWWSCEIIGVGYHGMMPLLAEWGDISIRIKESKTESGFQATCLTCWLPTTPYPTPSSS